MKNFRGVVVRIAYAHSDRTLDHIDVRLDEEQVTEEGRFHLKRALPDLRLLSCYRCEVEETGPQECAEPAPEDRGLAEVKRATRGGKS